MAVLGLPHFVDRADVRVVDSGRSPGLDEQPLAGAIVVAVGVRQHFERDLTVQPFVSRAVDDAHSTAAQRAEHAVPVDYVWTYGGLHGEIECSPSV